MNSVINDVSVEIDWNWFFSSLAQSTAAIVSIFGAFVIARILSNQEIFSKKTNSLKELLCSAEKIKKDAEIFDQTDKESGAIERAAVKAHYHTELIREFLASIKGNPESSPEIRFTLFLLVALFLFGIICPLNLMPMPKNANPDFGIYIHILPNLNSLKGVLLIVISVAFLGIIVMFLLLNERMTYDASDVKELEHFTDVKTYSKHFVDAIVALKSQCDIDKKWRDWENQQDGNIWWGE